MRKRNSNSWGGPRQNAGRKNRSGEAGHARRPRYAINRPLHIRVRVRPNTPSLRHQWFKREFEMRARKARKFQFYVLHWAILGNHLHMIVEAAHNKAAALGMRSLMGTLAKAYRARLYRIGLGPQNGSVCRGRYRVTKITTARQMRNTIRYVLFNSARHLGVIEHIDAYSSAAAFTRWSHLDTMNPLLEEQIETLKPRPCGTSPPRSWLARRGWWLAA